MNGQSGLNGIICIDKPREFTSFDVVAKFRGIAKTRKIGHGGTLDPMATGVLPLFIGGATKACDLMPDHDKRYTAVFRLGQTTDTQDSTGTVLSDTPVHAGPAQVEAALERFRGVIQQIPPMYSAVKVEGKRLYDLARRGVEVERRPREITIRELTLLEAREEAHEYTIDVLCSKGTYIRTLCHDLGQALGCGAVMTVLRRTAACGYSLRDCVTLEEAQRHADEGTLEERVRPVETAFAALPRLELEERDAVAFGNGIRLSPGRLGRQDLPVGQDLAVFSRCGLFLGVAAVREETGLLASRRIFAKL